MKITRVQIRNWRSIKEVDFYPSDITILVGANNAGKTNILSAINFLLGSRYPMPGNLDDLDFYAGDRTRDIYIGLSLDHPRYSFIEFDTSKDKYVLEAFDQHGTKIYGFTNAMREEIAFAYVDAARSFDKQFGVSRWTLFGQAMRLLHADLKSDGGARMEALEAALDQAHTALKTPAYLAFEKSLRDAFAYQLRTAGYDVGFEFRTMDENNLYRGLYPMLVENDAVKSPLDVGSGVRNLLVLALFQAFAESFRGGAVLGIEEPELYLHPHAQRSLARRFEELAGLGNQIFISSHSTAFLDITRSERIVVVERCGDDEDEVCTQVRTSSTEKLLKLRKALYPASADRMSTDTIRAFLRNIVSAELAEAFFSRLAIIVEGASEREALPILFEGIGLKLDELGISIVSAGGKTAIDSVVHLYQAHGIPTYVIFDNDKSKGEKDRAFNKTLCRLLGLWETDLPTPEISTHYAVLDGDWETQLEYSVDQEQGTSSYAILEQEARTGLQLAAGRNKPLVARSIALRLVERGQIPRFIGDLANAVHGAYVTAQSR